MDRSRSDIDKTEDTISNVSSPKENSKRSPESGDSSNQPSTPEEEQIPSHILGKAEGIRRACDLRDFDALVSYATSEGGFLWDDLRRLACKSHVEPMQMNTRTE